MLDIDELTDRIKTNLATPELKLDMPILDLGTLPIVEKLDMNNGWRHVVLDCEKLQSTAISRLTLSFNHGRLKYMSASMATPEEGPLITHQRHTRDLQSSQCDHPAYVRVITSYLRKVKTSIIHPSISNLVSILELGLNPELAMSIKQALQIK